MGGFVLLIVVLEVLCRSGGKMIWEMEFLWANLVWYVVSCFRIKVTHTG